MHRTTALGFALFLATVLAGLLSMSAPAPASAATQKSSTPLTASRDSAPLCLKPKWGMIN
ncbi:hypothetical protein GCM10010174_42420 [Kutzneria viridogrisea]|uniref:Uncharacterized protein n=1 Tax=Kutzneria viridogrisea TaxID=47990 RepID=A0ABR6BVH9_9PSEU|nr:hypothetical protein [Kutzneria viridogrisea]